MKAKPLYRSSNGDDWLLVAGGEGGDVMVLHRPNAASGGRETLLTVEEFLERGGAGPEHQALRAMIDAVRRDLTAGIDPAAAR